MAKKKHRKTKKQKQQRKAQPKAKPAPAELVTLDGGKPEPQPMPASKLTPAEAEYAFVGKEVRTILLITLTFVAIEVALWLIFGQTGLEAKLSGLLKL